MYDVLAGMTGTAKTEEDEFRQIYGLEVVQVPTNAPMVREDENDFIFTTAKEKYAAVVDDLVERYQKGQPLEAKMLSSVVEKAQVKVEELNFMRRKNVLKYDEVMNEQRRVVYDQRQRILMGEDFGEQVREMVSELAEGAVQTRLEDAQYSEEWDLDSLFVDLKQIYDPKIKKSDIDIDSATSSTVAESMSMSLFLILVS